MEIVETIFLYTVGVTLAGMVLLAGVIAFLTKRWWQV